jgi:hypothetical protein
MSIYSKDDLTGSGFIPLRMIQSGGQTGADRAALDFAIESGYSYTGWCPKDRKAEDGAIDQKYVLRETASGDYRRRTDWNARDADGTVIFTMRPTLSGGSKLTVKFAESHNKPWLNLQPQADGDPAAMLREFIRQHRIETLNVAGSRASKEPELYDWVISVLKEALWQSPVQKAHAAAMAYLGPEITVSSIIDNAQCSTGYKSGANVPDCWRVYFSLRAESTNIMGGDNPYILIDKTTLRVIGRGLEQGE